MGLSHDQLGDNRRPLDGSSGRAFSESGSHGLDMRRGGAAASPDDRDARIRRQEREVGEVVR